MNSNILNKDFDLKFKHLYENAPVCIHEIDLQGRFTYMNKAGLEMLGVSQEQDVIGKAFIEVIDDSEVATTKDLFQQSIREGSKVDFQYKTKNNRHFKSCFLPLQNQEGEITSVMGLTEDITANIELSRQLEIKKFALEESMNGVALSDLNGLLFYVNKSFLTMWRFSSSREVIGKSAFNFWKSEEQAKEVTESILKSGEWQGELIARRSDGTEAIFQVDAKLLQNELKEPVAMSASFIDVTVQRNFEKKILENEKRLNLIFNSTTDSIVFIRVDSHHLICEVANDNYLRELQAAFPGKEINIIGKDRKDVLKELGLTDEMINVETPYFLQAINTRKRVTYIANFPASHGFIMLEISVDPVIEVNGNCTHLLWSSRDITQKINSEHALKQSEERLRLALQAANQGIYDLNLISGDAETTPEYASMLGYDPATFQETNSIWRERLHPDDREKVYKVYEDYVSGKIDEYRVEFRQRTANNEWKWILSLGKIVAYDDAGQPLRMLGTHTDITRRKTAEQLLERANIDLKQIIDALDESSLVSLTDIQGTILKVNKRFCEVAGYDKEELIGKNHRIISSGHHDKEFWKTMWQTISKGNVWRGEIRNKAKDGRTYWVDSVINPVKDDEGKIYQFLSIRQDVTDRKIYEKLLLQNNASLKKIQMFADLTSDAIQVATEDGRIVYLNRQASIRLGIPQMDSTGYSVLDFEPFFEKDINKWKQHVEYLKSIESITTETINVNIQTGIDTSVEITARFVTIDDTGYILATSRDITERKRNEQKLKEFQERLEEAQKTANLGYWEYDLVTSKLWWSKEQLRINGFDTSDESIITQDLFLVLVHPNDRNVLVNKMQACIQTGEDVSLVYRIIRRDNQLRYIKGIAHTTTKDGKVIKISGVNQDITDSIIAEKALKESEETLRKAQEVAKIGSWKLDVKNDILEWSDEAYNIFQIKPGTRLSYYDFLSYVHPEDKDLVDQAWQNAVTGITPYDLVHRIIVTDKIKWVREKAELTFGEHHDLLFGFGTVQDITDQKILQDTNQIFNQVQLLTGYGSWRWSVLSNDLFWSDNVYNLLNLDPNKVQLSYDAYLKAIHVEDRERVRNAIERSLEKQTPFSEEFRIKLNNNEVRWLHGSSDVIVNDAGVVTEIYGVIRDITNEKKSTLELIYARNKAEEAVTIKDEFLSVMSHEIRTPLNSVIGLTNLLLRRSPREDQHDILKTLKGSADSLLHLVNDILDFNKIRAGKIELESIPFNLTYLLQQIHASFNLTALDKGLQFRVQTDAQIPHSLVGDTMRINQIFNNLISNAIKFTAKGYVKVQADMLERTGNSCRIRIKIEDTGIGISRDKIDRIFLPFQQSEKDTSRKYGGTGLGLSIVKSLVTVMGGELKVNSMPGTGSEFIVELNLQVDSNQQVVSTSGSNMYSFQPAKPLVGREKLEISILYVEDVESNRFLIENLLADNQIKCTAVSSGRAALRFTKMKQFDLILMDIQMPGMDGYQVTEKIKKQPDGLNKETPVLAFTAEPLSDALHNKILIHGIQDVISKPFETDFLIAKIRSLATQPKTKEEAFISFRFYEEAFGNDAARLKTIKRSIIADFNRFDKKLRQAITDKDLKLIRAEVHRIRPIIKNLAVLQLLDVVEEFKAYERYSKEVRKLIDNASKLTKLVIESIKKLNFK